MLVGCDWSQIELRAAAWISKDPALTKAFIDGTDIHALTASNFTGGDIKVVVKERRQAAKPVNFGAIFGMGARKLAAYAFGSYGVEISESVAKQQLDKFHRRFGLLKLHQDNHAAVV
jgi:DNA polymerase-1